MPSLAVLFYIPIALDLAFLAVAGFAVATGKSPVPAPIASRLPQVPASPRDQRWLGAAWALMFIALLANAVGTVLTEGQPGEAVDLVRLGAMVVWLVCSFAFVVITVTGVRYVDGRDGTIATAWERLLR